jgi:hypothetical protein
LVVVRLRGEQNLGSTVIQALLRYKAELDTGVARAKELVAPFVDGPDRN